MNYLESLATFFLSGGLSVEAITDDRGGVEGLYSQQFSVGIFFFLLISIILFTVIVFRFMSSSPRDASPNQPGKRLKTGEKIMFFFIYCGIVVAVIMAAVQLLQGYLF
ncbi:hypothetical protein Tel_00455 [Candidatus Tenderia electrophaga]|jgi:hypothetical protein|uniref:Uncharacterized protein n=1 Tax=Candidatus Tenderia electrophaga TaxID=1748243 RepID=A0A0S2T991_9GAMM|nr:hypothetical protein Tel_00455 [Candidatus Tenderia electrophaga]